MAKRTRIGDKDYLELVGLLHEAAQIDLRMGEIFNQVAAITREKRLNGFTWDTVFNGPRDANLLLKKLGIKAPNIFAGR